MKFYNKKIYWIFFWPLLVIFTILFFADHYISGDEGIVINMAWQMWHGKKLYIDFVEYIAPGMAYFIYFIWRIIGEPNYLWVKIFSALLVFVSSIGVFLTTERISKKKYLGVFSALIWIIACRYYPLINHNVFSSLLAGWLMYLVGRSLDNKKWFYPVLAGGLAGLIFLFLQTKGLILFFVAIVCFMLLDVNTMFDKIKKIFFAGVSFMAVVAIIFLAWDWRTIINALFIEAQRTNYLAHSLFVWPVIYFEIFVVVMMFLVALWRRRREWWWLLFFQAGLFISGANLVDIPHFAINAIPFYIFLVLMADHLFDYLKTIFYWRLFIGIAILYIFFSFTISFIPFSDHNIFYIDVFHSSRGGIFDLVEVKQAKYIYAGPFISGFYFELRKPNPFAVSNLFVCNEGCFNKVLEKIKEVKPEFAFINYSGTALFNYNRDNPVDNYFFNDYHYCSELNYGSVRVLSLADCPVFK